MKRLIRLRAIGLLAFAMCAAFPARAEVRSLTLGIDTTCSMGLSECWWLTLEGLVTREGVASVKDPPDNRAGTGEITTRDGRLLDFETLARYLSDLRNGSTLRGVEATVDGHLERHGDRVVLRVSGTGDMLRLEPLRKKIQIDPQTKQLAEPTPAERDSFNELMAKVAGEPPLIRVTGPLRKAGGQPALALEVRQFDTAPASSAAADTASGVASLTLGVDVRPYGLSEVWSEFREELNNFPGVASISEEPCRRTETLEVQLRDGRLPDVAGLGAFISRIGVGATLRGIEATVDGQVKERDGRLVIQVRGTDREIPLAPVTRKVQFDLGKNQPHALTAAERQAYGSLLAKWNGRPRQARIIGPVVTADGQPPVLEVRQFELQNVN